MDLTTVYIVSFGLIILVTGYFLPAIQSKSIARLAAWGISVLSVVFATVITGQASALYRMVAIISLQLLSMKSIVAVETYTGKPRLTFIQWLAFALGWFGMRPVLFEKFPSTTLSYGDILVRGVTRIIVGVLLVYLSFQIPKLFVKIYFLEELILLVGFSLILHFGILNVSTALWRISGVDVRELFRAPYKSRSLKEFWGKRWNLAFSEMTALIAYKPLK
ncbi:MAG TPA: MBOAT family protein, partial [Ohtaekwangia sp.]|uniref:MBOAT family protein n=1 Tax=Ohtaekwangia sp. TaxID=2066019 RepID=UPI002F958DCE